MIKMRMFGLYGRMQVIAVLLLLGCAESAAATSKDEGATAAGGCVLIEHQGETNKPIWSLRICEGAPLSGKWVGGSEIAVGLGREPFKRLLAHVLRNQAKGQAYSDSEEIGPFGTFHITSTEGGKTTKRYKVASTQSCVYFAGVRAAIGDGNDALVGKIDEIVERLDCKMRPDAHRPG